MYVRKSDGKNMMHYLTVKGYIEPTGNQSSIIKYINDFTSGKLLNIIARIKINVKFKSPIIKPLKYPFLSLYSFSVITVLVGLHNLSSDLLQIPLYQ